MSGDICILGGHKFKPGDPPPDGYNAWHEWARVQNEAGLKQQQCGFCSKWRFPQELSGKTASAQFSDGIGGRHTSRWPICKQCDEAKTKEAT